VRKVSNYEDPCNSRKRSYLDFLGKGIGFKNAFLRKGIQNEVKHHTNNKINKILVIISKACELCGEGTLLPAENKVG